MSAPRWKVRLEGRDAGLPAALDAVERAAAHLADGYFWRGDLKRLTDAAPLLDELERVVSAADDASAAQLRCVLSRAHRRLQVQVARVFRILGEAPAPDSYQGLAVRLRPHVPLVVAPPLRSARLVGAGLVAAALGSGEWVSLIPAVLAAAIVWPLRLAVTPSRIVVGRHSLSPHEVLGIHEGRGKYHELQLVDGSRLWVPGGRYAQALREVGIKML